MGGANFLGHSITLYDVIKAQDDIIMMPYGQIKINFTKYSRIIYH